MLSKTTDFVKKFRKDHPFGGRVLDVGSLDVNGNIKGEFSGMEYLGIDMRPGKNVDLVLNGHDIKSHFQESEFDLVICFDTLEHDLEFWKTTENMKWVLKKNGWLLAGAPSIHHPRHNYPYDYYRFTRDSFSQYIFGDMTNVYVEEQFYNPVLSVDYDESRPDQVFGWGQKL
jgi:SAM-dependent methyltransferase